MLIAFAVVVICLSFSAPYFLYYETKAYRADKNAEAETVLIVERAKAERTALLIKQGDHNAINSDK